MEPKVFKRFLENYYVTVFALFLVVFIYYFNTIQNKYALDDAIVITKNEFTKQGVSGIGKIFSNDSFTGFFGIDKKLVTGGRYRPLSIATFAIEYEFFGLNPYISHFINVLLYALTAWLIFFVFCQLPIKESRLVAFLVALLFVIHPIHTEVIANIKGRDEILALLFSLLSLQFILKYRVKRNFLFSVFAGLFLFLGLLSKENTVSFLVLIPAAIYFFYPETKIKSWLSIVLPLFFFTFIYLAIRFSVIGINSQEVNELMNNPFLGASTGEKFGTIFYTLLLYIKLLIFPNPLTYDYYPYQIPLVSLFHPLSLLSVIIYLGIIVLVFFSLKKKLLFGYALLTYLVPLFIVSNLFFPVGTFMNERFIYFSSLGFCLLVAIYLVRGLKTPKYGNAILFVVFVLIVSSGAKTISRNKVWTDDYTLFTTDVKTSKNSAKSNCTAGGTMFEKAQSITDSIQKVKMLNDAIHYLERSVSIYPQYIDALLLLGNAYWERDKNFEKTWKYYSLILKRNPAHSSTLSNSKIIANNIDEAAKKHQAYKQLEKYLPNDFDVLYNLGHIKGRYLQQLDSSIFYLNKAVDINPKGVEALKDLGVAYGIKGDFENSLNSFNKALEININDKQLYINIGVTYQRLGNIDKANEYFIKAQELNN